LLLGPQPLEEKNKLEVEENHGIDARATQRSVAVSYQFPDKRKVECGLQAPVEGIIGYEFFERKVREWGGIPFFGAHHVGRASCREGSREVNVTSSSRNSSSGKQLTRELFQHAGSF
jgi:hypothetical protein